jgi:putative membrane protein
MQTPKVLAIRMILAAAIAALPLTVTGQTTTAPAGTPPSMDPTAPTAQMGSSTGTLSVSDKKFVKDAAEGGMAEVEMGKLATEKASSEAIKKFGQRMVDDHTKAGDQLKQVASEEGIQLPDKLSAKDEMTKDRLSKLSGEQFDKAYMSDMVKDHTQDVAEFKRESNSGTNPQIKNFAAGTLPTLEDHLKEAKKIEPMSKSANNMKGSSQ